MIVNDLVPCRLLLATCPSGRRQLFHILEQPSNSNWFSFYPFHKYFDILLQKLDVLFTLFIMSYLTILFQKLDIHLPILLYNL